MPEQIRHPEWRAENDTVAYPFADHSSLVNRNGDFFTEGCFLDATFYVIGASEQLYISKVTLTHETCTIQLGDITNDNRASGTFSLVEMPDNIRFVDVYGRPAGLIVSEAIRLSIFQSWSIGTHLFLPEETELAATCCVPVPATGLLGFVLEDGTVYTGDVWIVGDDGVIVRSDSVSLTDETGSLVEYPVLRVDVVGDPLFRRRLCSEPVFFQTPKFIQTITARHNCREVVVGPDDFGDFKLTVGSNEASDTILRIRPMLAGIVVEAAGEPLSRVN